MCQVRAYAVSVLERASDDELESYLLQLVHALRYERCDFDHLAAFLVDRGERGGEGGSKVGDVRGRGSEGMREGGWERARETDGKRGEPRLSSTMVAVRPMMLKLVA